LPYIVKAPIRPLGEFLYPPLPSALPHGRYRLLGALKFV
jgi:hypothetical protein